MSTEQSQQIKDDITIASEDVEVQQEQPLVARKKTRTNFWIWISVVLVFVAGIVGLVLGLMSGTKEKAIVPMAIDDAAYGADTAPTPAVLDFQLTESYPSVIAVNLHQGEIVYIKEDTGCLNVIDYDGGETFAPLCKQFANIRSVAIHGTSAVIAEGPTIELYKRTDANEWVRNPGGAKRTSIIYNDAPGFGRKMAYLEHWSQVVIASGEHVFVYKKQSSAQWKLKKIYENVSGFSIDEDQTTLAVYDSDTVTVYDLSSNRWYVVDDAIVYQPSTPIASVKVSDGGIHVVSTSIHNAFSVSNLVTGDKKNMSFQNKVVGDAIYSVRSGCVVDATTGEYLSVDVQDADEVFDIKISEDHIVVLLERNGERTMDIYAK